MELTADPDVVILERAQQDDGVPFVIYEINTPDEQRRWVIRGTCNACGLCEVGVGEQEAAERQLVWQGEPGTPYACVEANWTPDRIDSPVRPDGPVSWGGCALSGEYLG